MLFAVAATNPPNVSNRRLATEFLRFHRGLARANVAHDAKHLAVRAAASASKRASAIATAATTRIVTARHSRKTRARVRLATRVAARAATRSVSSARLVFATFVSRARRAHARNDAMKTRLAFRLADARAAFRLTPSSKRRRDVARRHRSIARLCARSNRRAANRTPRLRPTRSSRASRNHARIAAAARLRVDATRRDETRRSRDVASRRASASRLAAEHHARSVDETNRDAISSLAAANAATVRRHPSARRRHARSARDARRRR